MKLSDNEAFDEIIKRGDKIRKKHEQRVMRVLSATTAVLAVALLGVISFYGGVGVERSETDYGSFFLPAEAGGYVIAALIAFALGIMIAACIRLYRNKNDAGSADDKKAQGNS